MILVTTDVARELFSMDRKGDGLQSGDLDPCIRTMVPNIIIV